MTEKVNPESDKPIDPLLKYKEHERERIRERKIKDLEHNKSIKFQHKLEDLERWEKNRDREKAREIEKLSNFKKIKDQLTEEDLNYDSSEERRRASKYPKEHEKYQE